MNKSVRRKIILIAAAFVISTSLIIACGNTGSHQDAESSANAGTVNRGKSEAVNTEGDSLSEKEEASGEAVISFDFTRSGTPASNQIAVWVENLMKWMPLLAQR